MAVATNYSITTHFGTYVYSDTNACLQNVDTYHYLLFEVIAIILVLTNVMTTNHTHSITRL